MGVEILILTVSVLNLVLLLVNLALLRRGHSQAKQPINRAARRCPEWSGYHPFCGGHYRS